MSGMFIFKIPALQQRTQTYMADPFITELEVMRVLDGLTPHKGAGPDAAPLLFAEA